MKRVVSWLDVKLGLRMLLKYPGLTFVGGLGMAVAIGIASGFFTFINATFLPRLPLPEGDRIIALENWDVRIHNEARTAIHDYVGWRAEMKTVRDVAAFRDMDHNLIAGDAPPELVQVAEMTASGFRVARVPPLMGRYFNDEDDRPGAAPVAVIGYSVWQNRFHGDPHVVGKELRLGTTIHTIVGVMPEGFGFPRSHRLWIPLKADPAKFARGTGPYIYIFARLAPGRTLDEVQAELSAIGKRSAAAYPESHKHWRPYAMPYTRPLLDVQDQGEGIGWQITMMNGMVALLLVVVALNVAVLVYARTAMRRSEIAVRTALGASRRRIVGQLFVEALLLSLGAAAVGLAIAQYGLRLGNGIMETEMGAPPFWSESGIRASTILYTVGLAVLAAVIVGVLPALQSTGKQLQADLRQMGGGTGMQLGKTWTALIVIQVAIAVAALPAAINMGYNQIREAASRPIYQPERFLSAGLTLLGTDIPAGTDTAAFQRARTAHFAGRLTELLQRVRAEPGVEGTTFMANLPGRGGTVRIEVEGVPAPRESPSGHAVRSRGVGLDYFDVFGLRTLAGRPLTSGDIGDDATAVMVDRAFVRKVLGGGNALGRRIRYVEPETDDDRPGVVLAAPKRWYEIVGVVEDLQTNAMDADMVQPRVYYAVAPEQVAGASIAVRLKGAVSSAFSVRLRVITTALDPTLWLGEVRSMAEANRQERLAAQLVGLAVGLILVSVFLLSAAGIYALMSFTVTRRRREIGIRSALGAEPGQVLRTVFARAAWQIAFGVVLGAGAALALERVVGGDMMDGRGPVILPIVSLLMAVVGLLAALGPARRGLRIEPTEALRAEG